MKNLKCLIIIMLTFVFFSNFAAAAVCKDILNSTTVEEAPDEVADEVEIPVEEDEAPGIPVDQIPGQIPTVGSTVTYLAQANSSNELSVLFDHRNELRAKHPYLTSIIQSRIRNDVIKVRREVESGEYTSAYPIIDQNFKLTEASFADIHQSRMRIKSLESSNQTSTVLIEIEKQKIKTAMETFLTQFRAYKAHRESLERLTRVSDSAVRRGAFIVLGSAGRHNFPDGESFSEMIKEVYGTHRPTIALMEAEFYSNEYTDGTLRPMTLEMQQERIELDIAELQNLSNIDEAQSYFWLLRRIRSVAKTVRNSGSDEGWLSALKRLGVWIDGFTYDLMHREAFKLHLPDIHAVQAKPFRAKLQEFKERWGRYALESGAAEDFILTFARSVESDDEWDLVWRLFILEAKGRFDLIDELEGIYANEDEIELRKNAGAFYAEHDEELQDYLNELIDPKKNNISSASKYAKLFKKALVNADLYGPLTFDENMLRLRGVFVKRWALFTGTMIGGTYILANTTGTGDFISQEIIDLMDAFTDGLASSNGELPTEE